MKRTKQEKVRTCSILYHLTYFPYSSSHEQSVEPNGILEPGVSPAKRLRASSSSFAGAAGGGSGTPEPSSAALTPASSAVFSSSNGSSSIASVSTPGTSPFGAGAGAGSSNSEAAPQTPQTESATVGLSNLRTSTPSSATASATASNGAARPVSVAPAATTAAGLVDPPGEGAVTAGNAMPGSVLPSAKSLNTAAQAQANAGPDASTGIIEKEGTGNNILDPHYSNGIPGIAHQGNNQNPMADTTGP